jgi:hypothetical protein
MADYTKKLRNDLKAARKLLDDWEKDPAEVFLRYGLVDTKEEVRIRKGLQPCACAPMWEHETGGGHNEPCACLPMYENET